VQEPRMPQTVQRDDWHAIVGTPTHGGQTHPQYKISSSHSRAKILPDYD